MSYFKTKDDEIYGNKKVAVKQPWILGSGNVTSSNKTTSPTKKDQPPSTTTTTTLTIPINNNVDNKIEPMKITTPPLTTTSTTTTTPIINNTAVIEIKEKEDEIIKRNKTEIIVDSDNSRNSTTSISTTSTSTSTSTSSITNSTTTFEPKLTKSKTTSSVISPIKVDNKIVVEIPPTSKSVIFDYDSKPKPPPKKSKVEIIKHKKEREKESQPIPPQPSPKVSKKSVPKSSTTTTTTTPTKKNKSKLTISDDQSSQSSSQDNNNNKLKDKDYSLSLSSTTILTNKSTSISKVLSRSFENNESYYEEAKNIIKQLESSNDSKIILSALIQLSKIVTEQCSEFTLILRSHSLFLQLCDCLMNLCCPSNHNNNNNDNNDTDHISSTPPSNSKNTKSPSSSTTTTTSSLKRSSTFDSIETYKKNTNNNNKNNNNNNIDLLSLFLSTTSSNNNNSNITTSNEGSGDIDEENENEPLYLKKKHRSNSGNITSSPKSSSPGRSLSNLTSPIKLTLSDRERKAINLASCFILYCFSNEASNIEHFSKNTIEFLYQQSIKIPDNYLLEFYTTPSRLPKSPKSPKSPGNKLNTSGNKDSLRKVIELESSIFSNFQMTVDQETTSRFSVSTPSLSLSTLSNLASNHINHSMKSRLKEFGLLDGMITLLSKYIDYLNPVLDLTLISPKLIGNIEYILKIIDQCLMGDIQSNRIKLLNDYSLSLFITYLRYLYIAITLNTDRLAGLDIKLIGSEAIISILNILLNITHENFEASKIIGKLSKPFQLSDSGGKQHNGENIEFTEYLDSIISSTNTTTNTTTTTTPPSLKKIKFLESIEIKENFSFKVIIQLLKLEVPEKYDIGQLCVSLLVNLVEVNPENREILHTMNGAIESILQLYLWRTSENKIITRVTSKTQEKIASSYLVILIGFLIKDHQENRQLVLKKLPSNSFSDPIQLLLSFLEFQFNTGILTSDIYKLVVNLIDDVFLINPADHSTEIKSKYHKFKIDYDKKLKIDETDK